MNHIYTIVNQKGGVGKTTTAINLGAYLAYYGKRVLLVDLDPQANATSCLGIDKDNIKGGTYEAVVGNDQANAFILHNSRLKLSILPTSQALAGAEVELVTISKRERRLINILTPIRDRYDYILVDCPPSLGLLTINGLLAAQNGVIIPVQCEYLALEGLSLLIKTLNRIRTSLYPELQVRGMVMTMHDVRTNLSKDVVSEVLRYFPNYVFKTIIPRSIQLSEAPSYGTPIAYYAPRSSGAHAYQALAKEVLDSDRVPLAA